MISNQVTVFLCVSVSAAHLLRLYERFEFLDKEQKAELRLVDKGIREIIGTSLL